MSGMYSGKLRSYTLFFAAMIFNIAVQAQSNTDVSLFMKKNQKVSLNQVESKSGNLYTKLGHHGPAIENEWFALRIYFNNKTAIDVYSKSKPELELREARWYPTKYQQNNGWGADYYKVGKTVGLGGIRLWDGKKIVMVNPVSKRTARVVKSIDSSYMEMLSEGVPYKNQKVNILIRVTVFSDTRKAMVEAFSQTGMPVEFVTGINYHKGLLIEKSDGYIATWGIHPEDVAAGKVEVGAALIYNKEDFREQMDDGSQILMVSKSAKHIVTWITSANACEPEINTFSKLIEYLNTKK